MEGFLEEYFSLAKKLKYYLGEKYDEYQGPIFELKSKNMSEDLKMAKILKQELAKYLGKKEANLTAKTKQNSEFLGATTLSSEINLRCVFLENEFDQELENLSDYQLLEISQSRNLDTEFIGVLEKVTNLGMLVSKSESVQKLLDVAITNRDKLVTKKRFFQQNLQTILKTRDITPDKLRNASTLKVEIPKFSGYDCTIDFFTFKSEFETLVEPNIQ